MFRLTDKGEAAAQKVDIKQNLEAKVIAFMFMCGKPIELEEIGDEIRLSDERLVTLLKRMTNEGLIEET